MSSRTASLSSRVAESLAQPGVRRAFQLLQDCEGDIEADQVRLTLIPAPPFQEEERARHFSKLLRDSGFACSRDSLGNVIACYDDAGPNPIVVGAHLDTVFPAETKLELSREGRVLRLPGISDNGAGLVALLWVLRAAREAGVRFRRPLWGVANTGEEGVGNLRGIRHLFETTPWGRGPCDFIAVDGAGARRVVNRALGSRRFCVRISGPGGHSWADFGRPNPVQAMATAIQTFTSVSARPGTAFNIGIIHGGISVNSIPKEAMMEVDIRAAVVANLDHLSAHLERCVRSAMFHPDLAFRIEPMGERPVGTTSPDSELVQTALEVSRRMAIDAQLDVGSTDANLPMSLGIPAIALGAGGTCGNVHTPEEWFDPAGRTRGLQRLFGVVASLAGVAL